MKTEYISPETSAGANRAGKRIAAIIVIILSLFLLSVGQAKAYPVCDYDFEDGNTAGWSSSRTDIVPNTELSSWGTFLGQFVNDEVTLTLTGLTEGWTTLTFDTYFIRSWDGGDTEYGKDIFSVTAFDGITRTRLLYDTFSNGNLAGQSYGGDYEETFGDEPCTLYDPMTGAELKYALGYYFYDGIIPGNSSNMDSVYTFSFSFYNTSDYLEFIFAGIGLQTDWVTVPEGWYTYRDQAGYYPDESWGLDNVSVETASVPEPSTLLLVASGAFGLIPLSRRRKKN